MFPMVIVLVGLGGLGKSVKYHVLKTPTVLIVSWLVPVVHPLPVMLCMGHVLLVSVVVLVAIQVVVLVL